MHAVSVVIVAVVPTGAGRQRSRLPAGKQARASVMSQTPAWARPVGDVPLKQPFGFHQDTNVLDATTVGKVEALREVGLQVGTDLLTGLLTLEGSKSQRRPPNTSQTK